MAQSLAITDWATDYDLVDPTYVSDPFPIWDDLRSRCPISLKTLSARQST